MQSFEFEMKEKTFRKFVHIASRYDTLAGSIYAVCRLDIPAILNTQHSITLDELHQQLLTSGAIANKDSGPLKRILKYLSCYGIFNIANNVVTHTETSKTLANSSVMEACVGLDFEAWKAQGDIIEYFAKHSHAQQLTSATISEDRENVSLKIQASTPEALMIEMANLHLLARAIYTTSRLNIADLISQDACTIDSLSQKLDKNKQGFQALINLLVRFKLLAINNDGILQLTPFGAPLKEGEHDVSIKAAAGMANQYWWNCMGDLNHCIKTGEKPYVHVNDVEVFDYLEGNADERKRFDRGLANSDADQDLTVGNDEVAYAGYKTIVDIGGGNGGLIAQIKSRYPEAETTLFEQPGTVDHLRNAEHLKNCVLQPGNFLAGTPDETLLPKHKQLYVIKGVLHDFTDDEVVKILRNIRVVMSPFSELKIIDRYIQDDNKPHLNKTGDIQMMGFFAAKERTFEDYQRLAEQAGLSLDESSLRQCGNYNIITAKRTALEDKHTFFVHENGKSTDAQPKKDLQLTK